MEFSGAGAGNVHSSAQGIGRTAPGTASAEVEDLAWGGRRTTNSSVKRSLITVHTKPERRLNP